MEGGEGARPKAKPVRSSRVANIILNNVFI